MKRKAWLLLFTAMTFLAVPAYAQREFLCGFTGFDYVIPPTPGAVPFIAAGQDYRAVGFVTQFSTIFTGVVTPGDEHTFYLQDASAATATFVNNTLEVSFAPHARFRIYEDPVHDAVYGVNPPNVSAPAFFTNGTLILGADVNNLVLVYDYDANQGNFDGTATLDEGSDLYLIPPSRRAGWVMSGHAGRPNATVPEGYVNQLDGEIQIPSVTPTSHKTWISPSSWFT